MTFIQESIAQESKHNTSDVVLGENDVYDGQWEDVMGFESVQLTIKSDTDSKNGGVYLQWSTDGVTMGKQIVRTYTSPGEYTEIFRKVSRYFKVMYVNCAIVQTMLELKCYLKKSYTGDDIAPQIVQLDDHSYDSFSRLRISNAVTLFQISHTNGLCPEIMTNKEVGGGSVALLSEQSCVQLHVSTDLHSRSVCQSRMYIPYQPGKSIVFIGTGVMSPGGGNGNLTKSRIGLFDDSNGGDDNILRSVLKITLFFVTELEQWLESCVAHLCIVN